jgi:hypothetical protein
MSDFYSPVRRQLRPPVAIPFGIASWVVILFFVLSPRAFVPSNSYTSIPTA